MALRSQLITKEFPELDRVERLNNEAFPEEERIPLSEFLQLDGRDDYHFFAFYDEDDFVGFASVLYNANVFLRSFLKCGVMATEVRLLINWWTFMDHRVLWSWK